MFERKEYSQAELKDMPSRKRWRKTHYDHWVLIRQVHNRNYQKRYPEREAYSLEITKLVQSGRLVRGACCLCGGHEQVECCSFIPSLRNPTWLCNRCHRKLHELMGHTIQGLRLKRRLERVLS